MEQELKAGDVVKLKGAAPYAPTLIIDRVAMFEGRGNAYVVWFDAQGRLNRDELRVELLEKASA